MTMSWMQMKESFSRLDSWTMIAYHHPTLTHIPNIYHILLGIWQHWLGCIGKRNTSGYHQHSKTSYTIEQEAAQIGTLWDHTKISPQG